MVLLFAWCCLSRGFAQDHWLRSLAGTGSDHVSDVQVDDQGNIYVTGEFSVGMEVDGQPFTAVGARDAYVARFDATGSLIWLVTAGGAGIDRGTKLFISPDGTVAVAGQYMGTADLFGTLAFSFQNTLDVFIAKLEATTGQPLWVRTAGGVEGAERVSGITVSPAGDVTVAGEFKGEMWFDNTPITSTPDPNTQQFSFDVFVVRYDAAGDLLWVKQGAGSFADKAVDLVGDAAGGVYVVGQFSDTIAFDQVHPNTMFNASFLIKFSATGQEEWFRRWGGALFNQARGITRVAGGGMLIAGDVRGTLTWIDGTPTSLPVNGTHGYYLLRVSDAGALQASIGEGSASPIAVGDVAIRGDSIAVLGTFECGFSGMRSRYGSGTFIATGDQDLFIARHRLGDLALTQCQQFGGRATKRAGAVAWAADGGLLFTGSYTDQLIFPADGGAWPGTSVAASPNATIGTYCGDPHYGLFRGREAFGLQDGFLAKGYVSGRSPYDFWAREAGGPCVRDARRPRIVVGLSPDPVDSIAICWPPGVGGSSTTLSVDPYSSWSLLGSPAPLHSGPGLSLHWSTGATSATITPTAAGWLFCDMTTPSGCPVWTDSIHVRVSTPPTVLLSDGMGWNVDAALGQTIPLYICGDPIPIWPSTLLDADSIQWYENGVEVPGFTVFADTTAFYTIVAFNNGGCTAVNSVAAILGPPVNLPTINGAELRFYYQGQPLQGDTIALCEQVGCALGTVGITWLNNGQPVTIPAGVTAQSSTDTWCHVSAPVITVDSVRWSVSALNPGWNVFTTTVTLNNSPCGTDQVSVSGTDSVYILTVPLPSFDPPFTSTYCAGDTLELYLLNCVNCDTVLWTGPGIISLYGDPDTAVVNLPGTYGYRAQHHALGITCTWPQPPGQVFVMAPQPPSLYMLPPDGQVCPGDTVLLYTLTAGTGFQWYGPDGAIPNSGSALEVVEPGEYTLEMVNNQGCPIVGGPLVVGHFGTPWLVTAQETPFLCAGDSMVIEVQASGPVTVQWQPPLSGSAMGQVVHAPGTYTCVITSCGIAHVRSITVLAGTADATVSTPGPYALCPGDTVVLAGPPGQPFYAWQPGSYPGQFLPVAGSGQYHLIVIDDLGCADTSTVVIVDAFGYTSPLSLADTTVCSGSEVTLIANGSGDITWYSDADTTTLLGQGPALALGSLIGSTTVYATQSEGPCTSVPAPVQVVVVPVLAAPGVEGPLSYCEGDVMGLSVIPAGSMAVWWGPAGSVTGSALTLPALAGSYQVHLIEDGCPSDTTVFVIAVDGCDLVVPNAITPNGDGHNDVVFLEAPGDSRLRWEIFDRWGHRMYLFEGRTATWDGRSQFSGEPLSEGTYFYLLQVIRATGEVRSLQGYITLIR